MFDTQKEEWITVETPEPGTQGGLDLVSVGGAVQIGVFPLPMHCYETFDKAR